MRNARHARPRFRHRKPRLLSPRTVAGVLAGAATLVILTGLVFSLGAHAQASQPASVTLPAASTQAWARDAPMPVLRTATWATLVRWCHADTRHTNCDVLPSAVRSDEHLGQRPARMVTPNGDTVFIVADDHGRVRIVDES